jgi:hypothetical protein
MIDSSAFDSVMRDLADMGKEDPEERKRITDAFIEEEVKSGKVMETPQAEMIRLNLVALMAFAHLGVSPEEAKKILDEVSVGLLEAFAVTFRAAFNGELASEAEFEALMNQQINPLAARIDVIAWQHRDRIEKKDEQIRDLSSRLSRLEEMLLNR